MIVELHCNPFHSSLFGILYTYSVFSSQLFWNSSCEVAFKAVAVVHDVINIKMRFFRVFQSFRNKKKSPDQKSSEGWSSTVICLFSDKQRCVCALAYRISDKKFWPFSPYFFTDLFFLDFQIPSQKGCFEEDNNKAWQ